MKVQLSDSFDNKFDRSVWDADYIRRMPGKIGRCSAGEGGARIYAEASGPAGPKVMASNGFSARTRVFQPHLAGASLLEITFVNYIHEGEHLNKYLAPQGGPAEEEPVLGEYLMGFCLAIGSYQGPVGSERARMTDRVVQIHCDWWSKGGLWFYLNRNTLREDEERYRVWGTEEDAASMMETKRIEGATRTLPGNSVALVCRHNPLGFSAPFPHRWGLGLADDGNTLYWTLDGVTVDTQDITGFFHSSPGCVAEGAYVTIVGYASFQRNTWTVSDARISVG